MNDFVVITKEELQTDMPVFPTLHRFRVFGGTGKGELQGVVRYQERKDQSVSLVKTDHQLGSNQFRQRAVEEDDDRRCDEHRLCSTWVDR